MRFNRNRITAASGCFIILLAILAMAGKYFHIQAIATSLPGIVSMKFNSAVLFFLSGIALLLLGYPRLRPVVIACSGIVLLGGTLTLAEYIFHRSFGIDELFWKPGIPKLPDPYPARPSSISAFNFILISIALLLTGKRKAHVFIWILLQLVFLISVLAFITYAFSIATPNSFATFSMLFLHTAVMFMVLCAAIFYSDPLKDLKISFQRKLSAGFALILLVLSIVFLIYWANNKNFTTTSERVAHTNEVLHECEAGVSAVISAESAINSFLVTGNSRYTSIYQNEKRKTLSHVSQLQKLITDNAKQKIIADSLNTTIRARFILSDQLLAIRKKDGRVTAISIGQVNNGSTETEQIRNLFSRMQTEEKKLLAERSAVNTVNISNAQRIFYFFGFVMPVILIILGIIIFRNSNAKKKAEEKAIGLAATLEKRVQERTDELVKSETKFRTVIESSNDIISLSDEKFIPFYRSPSAAKITGWLEGDMDIAGSVIDRTHPDDLSKFRDDVQKSFERPGVPVPVSFRTRSKKGDYIWLEGSITNMLHDAGLGAIITNLQDVSLRKQSEEKMRKSERIYRTIASGIPGSVICLFDMDQRYILIEGDMLEKLGYSKEALLGNVISAVLPPERYKAIEPLIKRVLLGETFAVEDEREGGYDTISRFVPLKDENDKVYAGMIVIFEVSELKKAQRAVAALNAGLEDKVNEKTAQLQESIKELQSTQEQLVQQAKLASLGELTAGIAHEIQNPLNFVNNFAELNTDLLIELKDIIEDKDEELTDLLNDIDENSKKIRFHGRRADNIVKSMLQHSRRNTGTKELTDIGALADEYLRLSYHGLRAKDKSFNAKFEITADPAIGKVNVVAQDMGRVLLNLINNAFYAVTEKKRKLAGEYDPTVWVTLKRTDPSRIEISIRDNGTGMPEKVKEKIFQPFFTTKATGQGTGLGLSISNDIISQTHGGELKVITEDGEGTEFIISLPA